MSKRIVTPARPTAADVRKFAAESPNKFAGLTPEALHTLRPGARGRLHPTVIKAFNKGRKPERQYVLGRGKEVKAEAVALREKVVAAGGGKRGPIAKAVRETLAQTKA